MRSYRVFATALAALIVVGVASAQALEWTHQLGTPGFDVARAVGAHETGVYAFGAAAGALPGQTFAGGPSDVYLQKFDPAGNVVWTRQFGTSGDDFPMAGRVAFDDTGVYVAGFTDGVLAGPSNAGSYDAFVSKWDFDGNPVWTRQFGSAGFELADGIAAARGGIFVVGLAGGSLEGQEFGGGFDAFVRRYDGDGNHVWTRQLGGVGSEDFHGVAADGNAVYAAGSITPLPDFGGDGDALVAKYSLDGDLQWSRQFGASPDDHLEAAAAKHGAVYVAGYTFGTFPGQTSAGGADIVVRKYDGSGGELWTRQFGSAGNDNASYRGLAADGRGVWVTGNVAGALPGQTSAGSRDGFVRGYAADGTELSTLQYGTSRDDRPIAIAVGEDEDLYLAGRTTGSFPGFTHVGGGDSFVTKVLKGE